MTGFTVLDDPAGTAVALDPAHARRHHAPTAPTAPTGSSGTALPDDGGPLGHAEFRLASPDVGLVAHGVRERLDVPSWDGPTVAAAARDLLARAASARWAGEPAPILVGTIPFDSSRPAHLVVPAYQSWRPVGAGQGAQSDRAPLGPTGTGAARTSDASAAEQVHPVVAAASAPTGLPGRDDAVFRAAVGRAVSQLEDGVAEKVVLARTLDVSAPAPLDRGAVRAAMRRANPDAYVFDVELPGDQGHLVGASPELLVSVRDGVLHSHPLAGSAPRSADPAEDRATAQRLLTSEKDLREHAFVTDAIREVLRGFVAHEDDLDVPATPELVATSHLWHLGTPVTARLKPGTSVLDVVYALHPTPAVCGHPQDAARELIGSLEPFDRGFYTGLVGWADQAGNGEWAIVLRCGVVRGADVRLFAGAGVVVGSTPEGEHAETAVKFSTLLSALGSVS
ncbi:isochorismate synthase MenF [Oerskovia jenensis]|uniref:isochorismate synthase n=1 Tax=Oerskovia jenensis TaxID=162169 RepID=A0ABS2LHW8_9CELL|nr:isochorismate synthase [Oerskovia jenensis]MBM7480005.1 isochorismate synthase [Oerskovia jenensis]